MLKLKDAQKVLEYYGYKSKSIEPILIEKNKEIGIFATFKTKYGRLSRYIKFKEKEELEAFLSQYVIYQQKIDEEETCVEFDKYDVLSPNIEFKINIPQEPQEIEEPIEVEQLEIETVSDDNVKLFEILEKNIIEQLDTIENTQDEIQKLVKNYLNKLMEFNEKLGRENNDISTNINLTNTEEYKEKLDSIKHDMQSATDSEFIKYFDEAIELYESVLLDNTYLDNLYLIECYKEELRRTNEMISLYDDFNSGKDKGIFKKKKNETFEEYMANNPIEENIIDQNELVELNKNEASNKLREFKNDDIEELKEKYNIIEKEEIVEETFENIEIEYDDTNLEDYYSTLTNDERIKLLLISSPLKEIINILNELKTDKLDTILKEKYLLNKYKEMYDIFSNEDNYPVAKKCFKKMNLDSLEEFIQSLIDYTKDINIKTTILRPDTELKFKMGVVMKKGFVNGSLNKLYPINNKGVNNYYIVNTKVELPVYYLKKLLVLMPDNTLKIVQNEDVVTFKIDGLNLVNRVEVKVNNYSYKGNEFVLFNEKVYINCEMENGDN